MPLAEERAGDELDLVALAEHDPLDVVEQRLQDGAAFLAAPSRCSLAASWRTGDAPLAMAPVSVTPRHA